MHAGFFPANSKSREEHVQNRNETWSMYLTHRWPTHTLAPPVSAHITWSRVGYTIWQKFSSNTRRITGSGLFYWDQLQGRPTSGTVNPVASCLRRFLKRPSVLKMYLINAHFNYSYKSINLKLARTGSTWWFNSLQRSFIRHGSKNVGRGARGLPPRNVVCPAGENMTLKCF